MLLTWWATRRGVQAHRDRDAQREVEAAEREAALAEAEAREEAAVGQSEMKRATFEEAAYRREVAAAKRAELATGAQFELSPITWAALAAVTAGGLWLLLRD